MKRAESSERRGDGGKNHLNIKKANIRVEVGKGTNTKPVQSEHIHWGNQEISEPVCVRQAYVCTCVCCTLTGTILHKQSTK